MPTTSSKARTPWRFYKGGIPHESTLRAWRVKATQLAKAAGFWGACNLCKRPIGSEERYGRIHMRPALAWRGRATQRIICNSCYITLQTMLEELETLGARDHLPPEDGGDVPPSRTAEADGDMDEMQIASAVQSPAETHDEEEMPVQDNVGE